MNENPSSLIAMRDSITAGRINMIMRQRGWRSKAIDGNDELIDFYLKSRPRVTFLGLDTGSISGDLAALRIREIDDQARIVFVCSRSKLEVARKASHSAGAVAVILTPILATDIEEAWPKIMGVKLDINIGRCYQSMSFPLFFLHLLRLASCKNSFTCIKGLFSYSWRTMRS